MSNVIKEALSQAGLQKSTELVEFQAKGSVVVLTFVEEQNSFSNTTQFKDGERLIGYVMEEPKQKLSTPHWVVEAHNGAIYKIKCTEFAKVPAKAHSKKFIELNRN